MRGHPRHVAAEPPIAADSKAGTEIADVPAMMNNVDWRLLIIRLSSAEQGHGFEGCQQEKPPLRRLCNFPSALTDPIRTELKTSSLGTRRRVAGEVDVLEEISSALGSGPGTNTALKMKPEGSDLYQGPWLALLPPDIAVSKPNIKKPTKAFTQYSRLLAALGGLPKMFGAAGSARLPIIVPIRCPVLNNQLCPA